MESCSSNTETIISSLSHCLLPPHLAGWWLTMRGSHQYGRMTLWSRGLARSHDKIKYISVTSVPMAIKFGRRTTYIEGLLPMKLFDHLITWSYKITWQTKTIISPLPQCLWPPNFAPNFDLPWRATTHKVTQPFGHVVLQDYVTN